MANIKNTTEIEFVKRKFNFADSVIPIFKKPITNGIVKYGNKDDYGDYLINLFNKSSKHSAIINGKVVYIFGNGFMPVDATNTAALSFLASANDFGDDWNKVAKNAILDTEIFGGFALQAIPKRGGGFNWFNLTFNNVRTDYSNSRFEYKEDWRNYAEQVQNFDAFNPTITDKATIFYFKEYRPGVKVYPLPSWVACCNWIESDIEVSKATLTKAMTGFSASKMISFFNGQPADETAKRDIEQRVKNKFTGGEGETVMITFNDDKTQAPEVNDLGASDLTKEDFSRIDNLITQNIFAGHSVSHPLLFGIQQEGKLGSATELKIAFDTFKNTYATAKQKQFEDLLSYFASCNGVVAKFKIKDIEPVGVEFDAATILQVAPKEWITDKLGIDKSYFEVNQSQGAKQVINALNSLSPLVANKVLESMGEDEIRSLVNLQPKNSTLDANGMPIVTPTATATTALTNDTLVNITGRQQQALLRISRLFNQGKLSKAQAAIQLKGFGFTDEDINNYLGVDENPTTLDTKFSSDEKDIDLAFLEFGSERSGYNFIKSTSYFDDDSFDIQLAFDAAIELNELEQQIKDLLQNNNKLSNAEISQATMQPIEVIEDILKKFIEYKIIERAADGIIKVIVKTPKFELPKIEVFYTYEKRKDVGGADILPTSRPFCRKMVGLSSSRMWSRKDIQNISQRLGYNVFKAAGGFWNNNGTIEAHCRHEWVANAVIKKNK